MTDPTPPPSPVPPPPSTASADVRPTALQAVLTFVGGIVLAAGSCAGFLATLDFNRESGVNIAFALGFFASLLACLVGIVLIIVRQVRVMRRRRAAALGVQGTSASEPSPVAGGRGTPAITERGSAWTALVVSGALLAAAVGFVVLLVAADPNPIALVFFFLASGAAVGSLVALVIAGIRYSRGR